MHKNLLYNEKELLLQLTEGSEAAFSKLYEHYSEMLYYSTLRIVKDEQIAEELVQAAFMQIWQKKECIRIEESFSGYLFRIAQNLTYDFFRKLKRDRALYKKFAAVSTSDYLHVEEALLNREESALLETVMSRLPPQRRKVFYLCRIEGYSYKQVGKLLNITTSTVKDHLIKASRSIRAQLGHYLLVTLILFRFLK